MLQNSELFTVYGRNRGALEQRLPDPRDVAAAIENEVGDALAGVTIEVYLIPRRGWEREQETVIRAYWSEVFRQLGVRDRWSAL
jgi:hypothetical protein